MNQADKKEFELIHNKMDSITQSIDDLRLEMDKAHQKVDENLSFVKENLFNPHEGLWAETKLNTQFRQSTSKWRGVIGTGFIGLFVKHVWDMFRFDECIGCQICAKVCTKLTWDAIRMLKTDDFEKIYDYEVS